ncbi:peptidase C50, separase [Kipferlia bialata]|uniref:Peptidase C50, separase n=1 Tax=Kipferlia bialata TaxID=797122 RepID=A0A9K3D207_9EUKA|nr:peptidase C50, separase [Kipferlia bialata]|eukprot:g8681.t1
MSHPQDAAKGYVAAHKPRPTRPTRGTRSRAAPEAVAQPPSPVRLMVDPTLAAIPWEALFNRAVRHLPRDPTGTSITGISNSDTEDADVGSCSPIAPMPHIQFNREGLAVVDPGQVLASTRQNLSGTMQSLREKGFTVYEGSAPSKSELRAELVRHPQGMFIYSGHGTGDSHLRYSLVSKKGPGETGAPSTTMLPVCIVLGCSSGMSLPRGGLYPPNIAMADMTSVLPERACVVGLLSDGLDGELDRFLIRFLAALEDGAPSVLSAVTQARKHAQPKKKGVRLEMLTGYQIVVFGTDATPV